VSSAISVINLSLLKHEQKIKIKSMALRVIAAPLKKRRVNVFEIKAETCRNINKTLRTYGRWADHAIINLHEAAYHIRYYSCVDQFWV
jgi:hypothetical protein